jgi:hypothetical protein
MALSADSANVTPVRARRRAGCSFERYGKVFVDFVKVTDTQEIDSTCRKQPN